MIDIQSVCEASGDCGTEVTPGKGRLQALLAEAARDLLHRWRPADALLICPPACIQRIADATLTVAAMRGRPSAN